MAIDVLFEYDKQRNIVFSYDSGELANRKDVDDFVDRYVNYFKQLGKKAYLVSNIDHLVLMRPAAEHYAERSRTTMNQHILGYARWGTNDWARMTLRTTSSLGKIKANIFGTREDAIKAIEAMRSADGGDEKRGR